MTLIEKLIEDAKAAPSRRVALPECEAAKTLLAARRVLDEGVGTPVLVSPREVIEATAAEAGVSLDGMEIVDTSDEAAADALAERYMAGGARLLSAKGTRRKIKMPMWYAMVMEELGEVDCTFCGHTNTTGDVLMAAQTIIGLKEGVDVPSIFALVETEGFVGPEGNVICFADCGLNPEPTASELASIAISAADNVAAIMGWEPRVGFLSYSTCGSGAGSSVDRVNEAIELVHERRPDIAADGEFQLDAAIDAAVAAKKVGRDSSVAGRANVLIFPDLNSANLAVKIVQRFAHGAAYGHTLSGFKCPVADSSRGATVDEIVGDIAMLVLPARSRQRDTGVSAQCHSVPVTVGSDASVTLSGFGLYAQRRRAPCGRQSPQGARARKEPHGIQDPHALPWLHLYQGGRLRRDRGALPPQRHAPRGRARGL